MTTLTKQNTSAMLSERSKAVILALTIGAALVFLTGFAPSVAIHNAAHDTRHTLSFPCH
jgi:cobalt transporter subunit CbtB